MNWQQLRTILWLRWRLTRNQWGRSGGLGALLAAVAAACAVIMGLGAAVGGFFVGRLGLGSAPPLAVMGVWLAVTLIFLFFWLLGLMTELQRSETIDLQRLMHLPVALGQMFAINYLASHVALSIVLMAPAMLGLALGLAFSRGPAMLLLVPLAASMILMITAWTYCLRGWLAAMMSNPRRRRAIVMGITAGFILLGQLPNLYFNVFNRANHHAAVGSTVTQEEARRQVENHMAASQEMIRKLLLAQKIIPPLWLPAGAYGLAEHRVLPALLGTLGCGLIGLLGLRRAYQGTIRFYLGEANAKAGTPPATSQTAAPAPAAAGAGWIETQLPGVPEQAAALALATLRSMLRAPEVKMAWGTSLIITLVLGGTILARSESAFPAPVKPFMATVAVAFPLFMLIQFLGNHFGYDRDGFRALVLSPADRKLLLLGKNLASLPVCVVFSLLVLLPVTLWLRLPPTVALAALFQLASVIVLASLAGNLLSILVPYRITAGSMKPTKMPALVMLTMMVCHLLFPLVLAPAFLPPLAELVGRMAGLPSVVPLNLILSIVLAALAIAGYWLALAPLGRLLQQRETKILEIVTAEVE